MTSERESYLARVRRQREAGIDLDLLRSYAAGPRIWDAMSIQEAVHELTRLGLIEPVNNSGLYQLTDAGRARLREEGQ